MDRCNDIITRSADDDDTEFERVTQMLPECFVSVKLENSDGNCEKVNNSTILHSEDGYGNPSYCFRHHCGSGVTESAQLPPWFSHCYSAQSSQGLAESTQHSGEHIHLGPAHTPHDASANSQSERVLKTSRDRCENPDVSTAGVDGSDSNTSLNYVLNQQRTGRLVFDSLHTTHLGTDGERANINCRAYISTETENSTCNQPSSTSCCCKNTQCLTPSSNNVTRLSQQEASETRIEQGSSFSVSSVNSANSRFKAVSNTVSKYSQTPPLVSLLQDAKTNTGEHEEGNSRSSDSTKELPEHHTPSKNCQCHCADRINRNKSEISEAFGNFCSKCIAFRPSINRSCVCCSNTAYKCKIDCSSTSNTESRNAVYIQHTCHCVCSTLTSHHSPELPNKAESIANHCINTISTKLSTIIQKGTLSSGRILTCSSTCDKINKKLHYTSVDLDHPFTCEVCFKNYQTSSALLNHARYHRGDRPYQCETCNKAFATNSHLVTHRRIHTGERPFQCQLCHRSFADRSAFVKHKRTHGPNGTIIKRFKCEECGNAFVDSCGLKKHIRIHTGERPYCCSVCEKTFSTSSTFVAHKRIHSGERPYKCEQCTKMFITKSHLLTHRRTHTGEKPFTCQVCNRSFADGSSFRRHERLHTGENRHMCDVCGKGFPFDTSLAKHKQSHVPGSATYIYMV